MKANQTLFTITTSILEKIQPVLEEEKPDIVLVHGGYHNHLCNSFGGPLYGHQVGRSGSQAFGLTIFKAHILKSLTVKLLP